MSFDLSTPAIPRGYTTISGKELRIEGFWFLTVHCSLLTVMIDGHAHLNEINDIDAAISRAASAGVYAIIGVGMDIESNRATLDIAGRFPGIVYPAVGYHPWSIVPDEIERNLAFVEERLPFCVALGEVGIDYKTKIKKQVQWEVYERLLSMAKTADKPVIIHSRFSYSRTFEMTASAGIERAVFHWFTGEKEVLTGLLDSGYIISVTPALAYSPFHRDAAAFAPLERIMVETDAPVEYQGKISEPADLILALRELARIKGISVEEAAGITELNTRSFYRLG
jgi:TatD DNase family protein